MYYVRRNFCNVLTIFPASAVYRSINLQKVVHEFLFPTRSLQRESTKKVNFQENNKYCTSKQ